MSGRGGLWLALVFVVSLLVELPARWITQGVGLAVDGVSGSLWQGHAAQWGAVGPLQWSISPWRMDAWVRLGFQGQDWQARLQGWPWAWRAELEALDAQARVPAGYRLAGQWRGALRMQGSGSACGKAVGRISVEDLALVEPWSLGLGRGEIEMDCRQGWRLLAKLESPGQHQGVIEADLLARQARISLEMQPGAGLTPVLRGGQWMGPDATRMQRQVSW